MPASFLKDTHLTDQCDADRQWLLSNAQRPELASGELTAIVELFALSPYVRRVCMQYPEVREYLLDHHSNVVRNNTAQCLLAAMRNNIESRISALNSEADVMRHLRVIRHCFACVITYRDFILKQPIQASLEQVSQLADSLIIAAYNWQYQQLLERYGQPLGAHGPQPMCIIAMGKLGGRELNFSSDIDLIFAYPSKGETSGEEKKSRINSFSPALHRS